MSNGESLMLPSEFRFFQKSDFTASGSIQTTFVPNDSISFNDSKAPSIAKFRVNDQLNHVEVQFTI